LSSDKDSVKEAIAIPNAELKSPGTTPREATTTTSACRWADYDIDCDNMDLAGYPMTMMPIMMPMSPCVNESQREMQPKVVKPRIGRGETTKQVKPAEKQDLKKGNEVAADSAEDVTTLMIRGIPCSFSQEALISVLQNAGL
jgi:hypothetical protein